jgi:hypothetical protein
VGSGRCPPDGDGAYRLDVYRQPVVTPDEVTTSVELAGGWEVDAGAPEEPRTLRLVADARRRGADAPAVTAAGGLSRPVLRTWRWVDS